MNDARRTGLEKARGLIEQARDVVAQAACEEWEYFGERERSDLLDHLPEIVMGDKAQKAAADAMLLSKAADRLDEAATVLNDVIGVDPRGEPERLELADVPRAGAECG